MDRRKVGQLLVQAYHNWSQGKDDEMLICVEDVLLEAESSPEICDNEEFILNLELEESP